MNFSQNYFELFNLPVSYDVDLQLLDDRYLALQKEMHPDNYVQASDHEKRMSMQWTTQINAAASTLRDPLARAIYLLELKGVEIEHNPVLPPAFLMQQIELREELEEIESDASIDALEAFKKEAGAVCSDIESRFLTMVESDLAEAETLVYEMQFVTKLLAEADQLEEKLLDY